MSLISDTSFLRVWVDTEKYPRDIYLGFRHLDFNGRKIDEYLGDNNWKTLYVNKSCMRDIEVNILDEGKRVFI